MTVTDVCHELGIGKTTAYRLLKEGHLSSLPGLKNHRIPRKSFEAYIAGDCGSNGKERP
jgi:excisionase family DNA binding protein